MPRIMHGHKYVRNKSRQASHAMSSKVHAKQVVPCHVHHANHVTHVMSKHVTPNMYMPCHAMAIMSRKIAKYIIFVKKKHKHVLEICVVIINKKFD